MTEETCMRAITSLFIAATALLAPTSYADQPNMQSALAALQQARASLERASADKGGHRVKAIQHVDAAIAEVKAGMRFDRKH